ncbi:hypothetical protein, partial [Verminephrobacter aporrectodeae]|uniref:hypothetical protein n=1 Tax=Verminephrobacter aporrectodeae TaxID=1110389 RepID=UPI00023773CA
MVNNTGRIYGDSIAITGATNNSTGAGGGAAIASLCSKLLALVLSCAVAVGGATASVPVDAAKVQPIEAAAVDTTSARSAGPAQIKA